MIKYATPLLITTSLVLAGCSKKAPEELPPAPIGTAPTPTPTGPSGPGYAPGSQGDFLANTMSDKILFDTDRFNVDSQDQLRLQSQAQWLAQNPNARITIEGHADDARPDGRAREQPGPGHGPRGPAQGARNARANCPDGRVRVDTNGSPCSLSTRTAMSANARSCFCRRPAWATPSPTPLSSNKVPPSNIPEGRHRYPGDAPNGLSGAKRS